MYCPNPDCPDLDEVGIPAEFLPDVTHCHICGAALVTEIPDWAKRESSRHDTSLVPVLKVNNAVLLPLAKSLLKSAGISFSIRNENIEGFISQGQLGTGFNPLTGSQEIYVEECNLEEARTLLEKLGRPETEEA